jgi:hypothetical protein
MRPVSTLYFGDYVVNDGSYYLYVHAIFVIIVTAFTWYTLYANYMSFADLAASYLRSNADSPQTIPQRNDRPSWRSNEDVQLRTVIVQNVPSHLRSDAKLRQWVESLGIGEVERALMDRSYHGKTSIRKLLEKRERTLKKLEKVYMQWARKIDEEKAKRKHYYLFGSKPSKNSKNQQPFNRVKVNTLGQRLMEGMGSGSNLGASTSKDSPNINATPVDILDDVNKNVEHPSCFLDLATVQSLRPKIKKFAYRRRSDLISPPNPGSQIKISTGEINKNPDLLVDPDDAIVHYTRKLSTLTAMVKAARLAAFDPEVIKKEQENEKLSPTAFVTFKTQRSAQVT